MPTPLGKSLIDMATDPEQYTHGEAVSWLADQTRQDLQRQQFWNGIKDFIPKDCKSILDVGCGTGWLCKKASEIGIRKWVGIEPSSGNFNKAKEMHLDIDVRNQKLEDFSTDEKFDCIVCIMIFSHIRDVDLAFKKLSNLINPNGTLITVLSAFHEGKDRYERRGRQYDVYEIDKDQYVDKSIAGGYGIADINRRTSFYVDHAKDEGFSIIHQGKISDSGYSAKDLLVFRKN